MTPSGGHYQLDTSPRFFFVEELGLEENDDDENEDEDEEEI